MLILLSNDAISPPDSTPTINRETDRLSMSESYLLANAVSAFPKSSPAIVFLATSSISLARIPKRGRMAYHRARSMVMPAEMFAAVS